MICPYIITYRAENASSSTMSLSCGVISICIIGCASMILWYKKKAGDGQVDFGGNANNAGSFGNGGNPAFPTAPAQGNASGGYNPVSETLKKTDNAEAGSVQSEPPLRSGEYRDMDSIDTSGLGIGIGDDDK